MKAHTLDLEVPVKITHFFSFLSIVYTQNAVNYFAPYGMHKPDEINFTSDYDLSKFTSNFFGIGFRIAPPKGVFGMQKLNAVELRYGYYTRSTGLNSNTISLHLKFKP